MLRPTIYIPSRVTKLLATLMRLELSALGLALMLSGVSQARAQAQDRGASYPSMAPIEQYLIANRKVEVALARSAAPTAISGDATILVLTRRGYETAVNGKNGFVCLVDRKWQSPFAELDFWNPKVRAPVCFNPQAARTVVPINLKRTQLALAGLSKLEIMNRVKDAFEKRELGAPEPGAMAYMMSKDQYLDDKDPRFQPHLMFYAPNTVDGADWGANLPRSPVFAGPQRLPDGAREPLIVFVVPVAHWSDGTAAAVQSHQ
jgi:hypothetical protein